MTTLAVPAAVNDALYDAIVAAGLPLPERQGDPLGDRTFVWDPDLSPQDVQAVDDLLSIVTAGEPMPLSTYQEVRAQMQVLRDLRQMGRNAYMNLSATDRDRTMYDAMTAVTTVLLAILRDE